jgi:hypothetical protein
LGFHNSWSDGIFSICVRSPQNLTLKLKVLVRKINHACGGVHRVTAGLTET